MAATTLRMSGSILNVTDLPARLAIEQDILTRRKELEVNLEEANAVHRKIYTQSHGPKKAQFKNKFQEKRKIVPRGACYTCGKFSHFKANCPKQGNENENKHKKIEVPERGNSLEL